MSVNCTYVNGVITIIKVDLMREDCSHANGHHCVYPGTFFTEVNELEQRGLD